MIDRGGITNIFSSVFTSVSCGTRLASAGTANLFITFIVFNDTYLKWFHKTVRILYTADERPFVGQSLHRFILFFPIRTLITNTLHELYYSRLNKFHLRKELYIILLAELNAKQLPSFKIIIKHFYCVFCYFQYIITLRE